ncbi:MAG: molecular chaperone TorD family protein [Bacteroidia bacterium]|nr:molecular chaperone TorD family protein [Bacteroidia bacterium]
MEPENNNITPDRKNLLKGYNMLLYFAGSMIMNEPTDECVIDFWVSGNLKKLPFTSSNPRFIKAASLLKDSCDDKETCRKRLEEDYYRLFAVTGLPLAPAQSSIYLADKKNAGKKVNEFYHSYGWQLKPLNKIPDDHLGIELLFLTKLVDKYMVLDDDPCCCEMRKEILRYIDQYLLSWIPRWNEDVQEYAHTHCYKGIGTLIYAGVEDLYKIFS